MAEKAGGVWSISPTKDGRAAVTASTEGRTSERAMISLDTVALFGMQVKPRQLRLEDGQATVVRSKDGVWTLADIEIAKEPQ